MQNAEYLKLQLLIVEAQVKRAYACASAKLQMVSSKVKVKLPGVGPNYQLL